MDGYYFCQYLMLDEFLAACRSDGVQVDRERARLAAFHDLRACDDGEQLFINLCSTYADATQRFAGRAISYGLIEDIARDLSQGIASRIGAVAPSPMAEDSVYSPPVVLGLICRVAEGKGASDRLHPIFASIEMSRMFWDLRPLPQFNACTELIVRKLFYSQQGYPACAYTAFTEAELETGAGGGSAFGFVVDAAGYPEEYQLFGVDGTLYHDLVLRQYERELDSLEARVERFVVQRKQQREAVLGMDGLNLREKDVLLSLLRNPTSEVTIDAHRTRHDTAYSTANTDLAHLEELGYLRSAKKGRALAYYAGSRLVELA